MRKTLIATAIALAFGVSAPLFANPTNTNNADSDTGITRSLRSRSKRLESVRVEPAFDSAFRRWQHRIPDQVGACLAFSSHIEYRAPRQCGCESQATLQDVNPRQLPAPEEEVYRSRPVLSPGPSTSER